MVRRFNLFRLTLEHQSIETIDLVVVVVVVVVLAGSVDSSGKVEFSPCSFEFSHLLYLIHRRRELPKIECRLPV